MDYGATPLHYAACSLAHEAMLALLRHGIPIRAFRNQGVDRKYEPPLHRAVQKGGVKGAAEGVELLVRWGAGVLELDSDGNTVTEVVGSGAFLD